MSDTPEDKLNKASEDANALAGIFANLKEEMKELSKAIGDSLDPLAGVNKSMSAQITASKTLLSLSKESLLDKKTEKDLSKQLSILQGQLNAGAKIQNGLDKEILSKAKEVVGLNTRNLTNKQIEHGFGGKILKAKQKELALLQKAQAINASNLESTKELTKQMGAVHGEAKKVNNAGKGFQFMADSLGKLGLIGKTMAKGFQAAAAATKEAAANGERFPRMKGAVAGVTAIANQFLSIPAILGQIIAMMVSFDTNAVNLSKSMNMSYEEGHKLDEKLLSASNNSKELVATHANLVKSQIALSEESGIYHERSVATLTTMTQLTERLGLSNKEAAKFEKYANASGKDFGQLVSQTKLIAVNMGKANGLNFNAAKLMKEIANVSATISSNLGNDPKKIAAAVVQAKLLGTTLANVASAGSKMVDFESSIAKELEAELLIGRDLNLERSRALALAGDMTGLAQELQEQVGTEAEWLEMNVIQRQALADSIGLNVEQMGEMFLTQEQQKALAEDQAQLKEDELDRNSMQLTLMQEISLWIENIKDLWKSMYSKEIRDITMGFKSWISNGDNLIGAVETLKKLFNVIEFIIRVKMFSGIGRMTTALLTQVALKMAADRAASTERKILAASETAVNSANSAAASAGPIALSAGTLIPVIVGGIATVMAAAASYAFFADGGVVPGTGNSDTVPAMLTPGEIVLNATQQGAVAGAIGGGGGSGISAGAITEAIQKGMASVNFTQELDGVEQGQTYAKLEALNGGYANIIN